MIVVAPSWGPSFINAQQDQSHSGALAMIRLQTSSGPIAIIGTYWPIRHTVSTDHADHNLWSRLAEYIHLAGKRESPIDYLKRLILAWTTTALASGTQAVILGGDLNSTWTGSESGGQRSLVNWATDNAFSNGPLLLSAHRGDTHSTRRSNAEGPGTWTDHLLHLGDPRHIDPVASYSHTGAEWNEVSDHVPF